MWITKRAVLYLVRNWKRSMCLFWILMIISTLFLVSITMQNSVHENMNYLQETYGGSFIVEQNINSNNMEDETLWEKEIVDTGVNYLYKGPKVDKRLVGKIRGIQGIEDVCLMISGLAYVEDIKLTAGSWEWTLREEEENPEEAAVPIETLKYYKQMTQINGFNNSELCDYFRTNAFEIVDGRHINENDQNQIIISDRMARENGLKIGDYFPLTDKAISNKMNYGVLDYKHEIIEPQIVGIFHVNSNQIISRWTTEADIAENMLFTDLETISRVKNDQANMTGIKWAGGYEKASFFVNDPQNVRDTIDKVKELEGIEWRNFKIYPDDANYKESMEPLQMMERLCVFFTIVVLCIAIIVLAIIARMHLNYRKQEITILNVVGIKELNIYIQIIIESLIVLVMAIIISICITSEIGDSVGQRMYENKINAVMMKQENQRRLQEEIDSKYMERDISEIQVPLHLKEKFTVEMRNRTVFICVLVMAMIIVIVNCMATRKILKKPPRAIFSR